MANEIRVKEGTPIVFADATDYSATTSGFSATGTVQLDLTSLANNAARQSAKADFGALRARMYAVRVGIEADVAPVAGALVEFYLSTSFSATAGTGNDGGATGADAAYADPAEWTKQLIFLGALVCTADAAPVVQIQTIGQLSLPHRYGQVVVFNTCGQALEGDAVEMFVAFVPLVDEVQ